MPSSTHYTLASSRYQAPGPGPVPGAPPPPSSVPRTSPPILAHLFHACLNVATIMPASNPPPPLSFVLPLSSLSYLAEMTTATTATSEKREEQRQSDRTIMGSEPVLEKPLTAAAGGEDGGGDGKEKKNGECGQGGVVAVEEEEEEEEHPPWCNCSGIGLADDPLLRQ